MSKHNPLTQENIHAHALNKGVFQAIEHCRMEMGITKSEMRILDWGCGKGLSVCWLRDKGYNAFGVDIDEKPVENGRRYLRELGENEALLQVMTTNCRTGFPDRYFHFVFSTHVFEHIRDIDESISEISRVTRRDGRGFHAFPARRDPFERHLKMPFIHWLPKGWTRKCLMAAFLAIALDPDWPELRGRSKREKLQIYFDYSVHKTFYRKLDEIVGKFQSHGFHTSLCTVDDPRVKHHKLLRYPLRFPPIRWTINLALVHFLTVQLLVKYASQTASTEPKE